MPSHLFSVSFSLRTFPSPLSTTHSSSIIMATSNTHIVLITGAASNLGLCTVRTLLLPPHTRPYTVILGSRSLSNAQKAVQTLQTDLEAARKGGKDQEEGGWEVVPVRVDIEDEESVEECVREVARRFGRVDTLINNAGPQPPSSLFSFP